MRGKRPDIDKLERAIRNIPAYAGKTRQQPTRPPEPPEHPRVCGENMGQGLMLPMMCGTSPRMRGKPTEQLESAERKRNIPAYAGKTQHQGYR